MYWGFKKITFTFYTYVLATLKNGVKFIQKLTPGFKSQMRKLENFEGKYEEFGQAVEIPKS